MELLLVAESLKDLTKDTLLTNIMLDVVFYIASWWLSVDISDQGLQIWHIREFFSLKSRLYFQPRWTDTSSKLHGTLWEIKSLICSLFLLTWCWHILWSCLGNGKLDCFIELLWTTGSVLKITPARPQKYFTAARNLMSIKLNVDIL